MTLSAIFILGQGSIGHCLANLLIMKEPLLRIVCVDPKETPSYYGNITYIKRNCPVTGFDLIAEFLSNIGVSANDVVIDLTTATDSIHVWRACCKIGAGYINTAFEHAKLAVGLPGDSVENRIYKRGLLFSHEEVRYDHEDYHLKTMAIFEHGANPGLISHFVKEGLMRITGERVTTQEEFSRLAQKAGLLTIHCAEDDQMYAKVDNAEKKLYNTWSAIGLLEEASDYPQIGCGSHELEVGLPDDALVIPGRNRSKYISFDRASHTVSARSYIPGVGVYTGKIIPHGEGHSLPRFLASESYSPSAYYVYRLHHNAASFFQNENSKQIDEYLNGRETPNVLTGNSVSGTDFLGALLICETRVWWIGSVLSSDDKSPLNNGSMTFSPTTIQVTAGVYAALCYMREHKAKGIFWPEQIPTDYILEKALPYLGKFILEEVPKNVAEQFCGKSRAALKNLLA